MKYHLNTRFLQTITGICVENCGPTSIDTSGVQSRLEDWLCQQDRIDVDVAELNQLAADIGRSRDDAARQMAVDQAVAYYLDYVDDLPDGITASPICDIEPDAWRTVAHAIDGTKADHASLAKYCEAKGFEVVADPDDNERSLLARIGCEDFGDRIMGEIVGDSDAVIVMYQQA